MSFWVIVFQEKEAFFDENCVLDSGQEILASHQATVNVYLKSVLIADTELRSFV